MFSHLLVPTDGSELSRTAISAAVNLAKGIGARITFLHVQNDLFASPSVSLYGDGVVMTPAWSEELRRASASFSTEVLAEAQATASAAGVASEATSLINISTYESILETARLRECDLIFMASHGRRGLAGLLLGSETQRVLTHSSVPVLVYKAP